MSADRGKVKFICTDRGRHKPRLLGEAVVTADGVMFPSRGPSLARTGRGRPRRSNTYARIDLKTGGDYAVWLLLCPSCPRHVEWRRDRAEAIARGLAERGKTEFDVSNVTMI